MPVPPRQGRRLLLSLGALGILLGMVTADLAWLFSLSGPARSVVGPALFLASMALVGGGIFCLWWGGPPAKSQ